MSLFGKPPEDPFSTGVVVLRREETCVCIEHYRPHCASPWPAPGATRKSLPFQTWGYRKSLRITKPTRCDLATSQLGYSYLSSFSFGEIDEQTAGLALAAYSGEVNQPTSITQVAESVYRTDRTDARDPMQEGSKGYSHATLIVLASAPISILRLNSRAA